MRAPKLTTSQRKQIAKKRERNPDGTFAGSAASHAKLGMKVQGALGAATMSGLGAYIGSRGLISKGFTPQEGAIVGGVTGAVGGALSGVATGALQGALGGVASHAINKWTGNTLSDRQKKSARWGSAIYGAPGGAGLTGAMVGYNYAKKAGSAIAKDYSNGINYISKVPDMTPGERTATKVMYTGLYPVLRPVGLGVGAMLKSRKKGRK